MINAMLQDQQEMNQLFQSGDFTSEDWLERYREIGLRFMNYLCEYGGEKTEVKQLIQRYQEYGEEILVISDLLEEAKFSAAADHLESVKELAEELEIMLKAAYEKAQ